MNKGRIVDILLIITLLLVAFGITYTLLTLNRGQTRPPPEPEPTTPVETPAAPGGIEPVGGDLPVIPEGLGGGDTEPVQPLTPGDETDAAEPAEEDPTEEQAEEAAPPRTLADGEVQLESIGFSFVTGGAGACGVELEAWQHVAVSRDLLADLGCGAPVTIELADETGGNTIVDAVIGDTMNPAHTMTVNIYVAQDEPALEYGRTTGILLAD